MKKKILIISTFSLFFTLMIVKTLTYDLAPGDIDAPTCEQSYTLAIEASEVDWQLNLSKLRDQEKPASKMVDEAYENFRTYNCWVEYICRSALYSGYAPIESVLGTGLTSRHLDVAPGCQRAEYVTMENNYNELIPVITEGTLTEAVEDYYTENGIAYFPSCQTGGEDNESPNLALANRNYQACKTFAEQKFENGLAYLEGQLHQGHASQKATALEEKLTELVTKLSAMDENVSIMSNALTTLHQLIPCIPGTCS